MRIWIRVCARWHARRALALFAAGNLEAAAAAARRSELLFRRLREM